MKGPHAPPFLRRWMDERGQQADAMADAIQMNRQKLYRQLRGEQWIPLRQAHAICQFLKEDYTTLFPEHSGIDPRDLEAVKHAALVGSDLAGVA